MFDARIDRYDVYKVTSSFFTKSKIQIEKKRMIKRLKPLTTLTWWPAVFQRGMGTAMLER